MDSIPLFVICHSFQSCSKKRYEKPNVVTLLAGQGTIALHKAMRYDKYFPDRGIAHFL
jgi:hypothetical protein